MRCESKVNGSFTSFAQRLIYGILGLPDRDDDWFEGLNNAKLDLDKAMKKIWKELSDFYRFLMTVGERGILKDSGLEVGLERAKPKKLYPVALQAFGVDCTPVGEGPGTALRISSRRFPGMFPAWKLLALECAKEPGSALFRFAGCVLAAEANYMPALLEGLQDTGQRCIIALDAELAARGYVASKRESFGDWSVNYALAGEHRLKIGYDARRRSMMHCYVRLTKFKAMWQRAEELGGAPRDLLLSITNKCSACRRCVKSGFKTMQPFVIERQGAKLTLCPWWPNTNWPTLDSRTPDRIRGLLSLQESVSA